jgi:hypothetical protein
MITCNYAEFPFGSRCTRAVTHRGPVGPLCTECAERLKDDIRNGRTLLNVLAHAKGISVEALLAKIVKVN